MTSEGILRKWYRTVENGIILNIRLHRRTIEERHGKPFTLIDIQTAFYCLGIGILVCIVVFIMEIVWKVHNKKLSKRVLIGQQNFNFVYKNGVIKKSYIL